MELKVIVLYALQVQLPYVVLGLLLFIVAWVFYIAAMRLIPMLRAGQIAGWVTPFAWTAGVMALVLDVLANLLASLMLLDFPRDWLLTHKLKRLKLKGGWRAKVAERICTDCLDAFDPSGDHC